MKHRTIPIFVPELACPNQCIYCNQRIISGQLQIPTNEEIINTIETHLSTFDSDTYVELGFFGGNFTGIELEEQQRLFSLIKPYCDSGSIREIRLSTRPDYINEEIIDFLLKNNVTTVELGVQSLDEDVLNTIQRGYTPQQVMDAVNLIKSSSIKLGMQMMVGLPKDTPQKSLLTAQKIVDWGADNTRIYPTLVIQHTKLADWYKQGIYSPLTLEQAVDWVKPILYHFEKNNVTVLRVGLHPTEGFINGTDYIAGPFHVAFKELVQTEIWYDIFSKANFDISNTEIIIEVPSYQVNAAVGHHAKNKAMLQSLYKRKIKIVPNKNIPIYSFKQIN